MIGLTVRRAIKRRDTGIKVETEAIQLAPIPVGAAILTFGGKIRFRGFIHPPIMRSLLYAPQSTILLPPLGQLALA